MSSIFLIVFLLSNHTSESRLAWCMAYGKQSLVCIPSRARCNPEIASCIRKDEK